MFKLYFFKYNFFTILFYLLSFIIIIFILSCTTKYNNIIDKSNGIVAISYYARNTSRLEFTRYYKILSSDNPNLIINIYPKIGLNYAFSSELPPGLYNFDKIKVLLNSNIAISNLHIWTEEIPNGIIVEVKSGLITLSDKRLYIDQYEVSTSTNVNIEKYFQPIPENEMKKLEQNLMGE